MAPPLIVQNAAHLPHQLVRPIRLADHLDAFVQRPTLTPSVGGENFSNVPTDSREDDMNSIAAKMT